MTDGGTITHHAAIRVSASTPDATVSARSIISSRRRAASTRRCPGSETTGSKSSSRPDRRSGAASSCCRQDTARRDAARRDADHRGTDPGAGPRVDSPPRSTEASSEAEAETEAAAKASASAAASASASAAASARAAAVAEESRRSQRGMSTPAQMTTIATYRIALLNNPPLAELIAELIADADPGRRSRAPIAGTLLPSSLLT